MLHCQSMKKAIIFVAVFSSWNTHDETRKSNTDNFQKTRPFCGYRKDLQKKWVTISNFGNYLCIQVKICFYQPDQSVLIFFLPSSQLAGLFPVHATRPDLNRPILSAQVWTCSFNSQLKTNIIRPKNVPIVCFRYQWVCHSFGVLLGIFIPVNIWRVKRGV